MYAKLSRVSTPAAQAAVRFDGVVGYHVSLTHSRSPVQARVESFLLACVMSIESGAQCKVSLASLSQHNSVSSEENCDERRSIVRRNWICIAVYTSNPDHHAVIYCSPSLPSSSSIPPLPLLQQTHPHSSSSTASILLFLNLAVTCPPFLVTSWSKLGFCAIEKSCVQ